jgi:ferredoxin-NADP reductase
VGEGQELAAQCRGMTSSCPHKATRYLHSFRDSYTVTGFSRTMTGSDARSPRQCQWHDVGGDLPFDFGAHGRPGNLMLLSGGTGVTPHVF